MTTILNDNNALLTPDHRSSKVTSILRSIQETPDEEPSRKKQRFVHLTSDQFTILLQCYEKQQHDIASLMRSRLSSEVTPSAISNSAIPDSLQPQDYYNNAKFEDLACKPFSPVYDGSSANLVSFMNKLHLRRQNEIWANSTYFTLRETTYDLLWDFTSIPMEDIKKVATDRWSDPSISQHKITFNHPTYNARCFRCLAQVLLSSLTDDFSLTLTNRIDTLLHHDGPFILWMIGHNIHRSNIAFTESVKTAIRNATLQDFHDDVTQYLDGITQNLRLITGTASPDKTHIDLLPHIFRQLCSVTVVPFKDAALQWHLQYLEGKSTDLTPKALITMADDKIRLLKHASQWTEEPPPAVMALQAKILESEASTAACLRQLTAHLTTLTKAYQHPRPSSGKQTPYPDWMITAPTGPTDTIRHANDRQYTWCTRCRRGDGLWVSTHTTTTHQDNFKRQRRQAFRQQGPSSAQQPSVTQHQMPGPRYPPPFTPAPPTAAPQAQPAAYQLSLDDCLNEFFTESGATSSSPSCL